MDKPMLPGKQTHEGATTNDASGRVRNFVSCVLQRTMHSKGNTEAEVFGLAVSVQYGV